MKRHQAGHRREAFTLVELLAVIVALGLLVALLLPAIQKTWNRGEQLRCMANMRPITKAVVEQYVRDHRLLLPNAPGIMGLRQVLTNYIAEATLFACPSDRGSDGPVVPPCAHAFDELGSSYAYATEEAAGAGIAKVNGLRITNIDYPTRKAVIFEPPLFDQEGPLSAMDQWHAPIRASVIGFLDGHVDLVLTNYAQSDTAHVYH